MEYKVGDTVRVKSLDWYNEHEKGKRCFRTKGDCFFLQEMSKYCGNEFEISDVSENSEDGIPRIKLNGAKYLYIPDFFEPVASLRYNTGKPQWSLVHMNSLVPMIRVLEYGALKYAPFNWQKPTERETIINSMQRHMAALIDGDEIDSESGLPHIGHIMANALFYSYHFVEKEK